MRSLLLLVVVSCATLEPRGSGGGISLATSWLPELVEAQPVPSGGITRAQADARYLKLTGGTITGNVTLTGTSDPLRMLYDENIRWCSDAACATYASLTYDSANQRVRVQRSSGTPPGFAAGGVTIPPTTTGGISVVGGAITLDGSDIVVNASGLLHTKFLQSVGVATGSLPTCNAGQFGTFENDTTADTFRECNDNAIDGLDAWRPVLKGSTSGNGNQQNLFLGFFRSGDVVVTEAVDFMGMGVSGESADAWNALAGQPATISCSWETTGVVGGASVGVAMELSDGTETCNCALGAGATECDATVRTNLSCDCTWSGTNGARLSAMTAGNKGIKLQMKNTTDCGTNPRNVQCTAYTRWGPL